MLKPFLEAKLNQSFPDPAQFKLEKEFNYAAKTASVFKKVVAEILMFVENEKKTLDALNKKKYGKKDTSYQIGK